MRLSILVCLASGILGVLASPNATLDDLVAKSNANIKSILEDRAASNSAGCTSKNVVVRKEWSTLTSAQKLNYIDAVKCMLKKPPITPLSAAPGVRHRMDDFTALHINLTAQIHANCRVWPWHREFLWLWETALREECSYTGYLPYWDWASTTTVEAHPLFDGSETSVGGNGKAVEHSPYALFPADPYTNKSLPSGTGGGCFETGPFANLTVNLGPYGEPVRDGLQYNPRCLTRDFRNYLLPNISYDAVTTTLSQSDFASFSKLMGQMHTAEHEAVGGAQDDTWVSAADAMFHFHHGQLDRIWTIWQGVDQSVRTKEVTGTLTPRNVPPSANGTLDTVNGFGFLAKPATIRDLSSTIDGRFCYIYA